MDCCSTDIIESRFNQAYVQKKLERYQRKGPKKTTTILTSAIVAHMRTGMTLLDIGGGIGDIQHILIPKGISKAINCEASSAFLEACNRQAKNNGYSDRIEHIQGDFVEVSDQVPGADIVTLDRVICCYPDMPELVRASLAKAESLYAIVIPRDTWFIKWMTEFYYNLRFLLQRNPFRVFVHSVQDLESLTTSAGFKPVFEERKGWWLIQLFARQV